jgi:hypothetical protein
VKFSLAQEGLAQLAALVKMALRDSRTGATRTFGPSQGLLTLMMPL